MTPFARTLARSLVVAAAGAAVLAWAIAALMASVAIQRANHATLDAASVALRGTLGNAGPAQVVARLQALEPAFETWNLDAAAFDRTGAFVAGDDRLRGDGLPAGSNAAEPNRRQIAIVPTRDGYVLLVPDVQTAQRMRIASALGLLAALALAAGIAFVAGRAWARERSRSVVRLQERLASIGAGDERTALAGDDDPLYGPLWKAARAAVDRLQSELAARTEVEEHLRAFLADAGHELRTPLAIAVGYTGILKRGGTADRELTDRIVGDIATEHERLQRLVERILYLARLDTVAAPEGAAADAVRIAQEAIALVRPLGVDRTIELDAPESAFAAIDGDDLRDALRNLLENAIRYTPESPVRTIVEAGTGITIRVADAGPGMDAFTAAHAFDRFFRGAERGSTPGSGLGLAIVRRVVERAGGSVTLESSPDAGTTVEVRLPRAR